MSFFHHHFSEVFVRLIIIFIIKFVDEVVVIMMLKIIITIINVVIIMTIITILFNYDVQLFNANFDNIIIDLSEQIVVAINEVFSTSLYIDIDLFIVVNFTPNIIMVELMEHHINCVIIVLVDVVKYYSL